jgi:hypothetical protein
MYMIFEGLTITAQLEALQRSSELNEQFHIIMSATTTVLDPSTVSVDDIELVSIDHRHTTGGEILISTQTTHKTVRDWKLLFQLISCGVSFFVAGVNDGSLGALLPYIIRSSGLTTAIASSVSVLYPLMLVT